MNTRSVIAILLISMVVIFTIQNTEIVTIKFLIFEMSISRVLLILGCFIVGFVIGELLTFGKRRKF